MTTVPDPLVLGVDPGHKKCGLALVAADGRVAWRAVVPAERLGETLATVAAEHRIAQAVVGDGTRSAQVAATVATVLGQERVVVRDETNTTLDARQRYWCEHPPRGLWRLIPTTMRVPPEPFDDCVAVILAERYWAEPTPG